MFQATQGKLGAPPPLICHLGNVGLVCLGRGGRDDPVWLGGRQPLLRLLPTLLRLGRKGSLGKKCVGSRP